MIRFAILASATLLAACMPTAEPPSAKADFADYCAACHGAGGKGGSAADLTLLAQRNNGAFPTTKVMAQIWGYTGKKGDGVMPDFAPLLEGDLVPYDGGDGIATPTPTRLVALAEYLKTLQE